jgi:hypothetical protein
VGLVAVAIPLIALRAGQPDASGPGVASSNPVVGGDLHSLVVDPTDPNTLYIGSHQGVSVSTDGGRSWKALGGVSGAMWVSWDQTDTDHIIVTGQGSATVSPNGGKSWESLEIPVGASIVEFSPDDPKLLFAAVLEAPEASVYVSRDGGVTWVRP